MLQQIIDELVYHKWLVSGTILLLGWMVYLGFQDINNFPTAFIFFSYIYNFLFFSIVHFQRMKDGYDRLNLQLPIGLFVQSQARIYIYLLPQLTMFAVGYLTMIICAPVMFEAGTSSMSVISLMVAVGVLATSTINDLMKFRYRYLYLATYLTLVIISAFRPFFSFFMAHYKFRSGIADKSAIPDLAPILAGMPGIAYFGVLTGILFVINLVIFMRRKSFVK